MTVLETALNEEITEHLGQEENGQSDSETGDVRNGTRAKTVLTEATGQVHIDVPQDRAETFEPQMVKKRQRRLTGMDEIVLSLYAKGLTTGEISSHFAEIYGASVSRETISLYESKTARSPHGSVQISSSGVSRCIGFRPAAAETVAVVAHPWK